MAGRARGRSGDRRAGGPHSCSQGTGPVHRRTAAARGAAAARAAPDQRGPSYGNQLMERIGGMTAGVLSVNPNTMYPLLRQLEERGLIEGQWEHPERRSRRYYSLTERRRDGVRAARGGGQALPRLGEVVDRRDRARGLRRVRTASADRRRAAAAAGGAPAVADVDRWSSFVEGFARQLERSPDWPEPGARVVWESTPDGRGRVTETVTESEPDRFSTQVFEEALMGTQTLQAAAREDGSRGRAEPRVRARRSTARCAESPTRSSSDAPSATRSAGPSSASRSRRRRRRNSARVRRHVRLQSRRRRGRHDGW